MHSARPPSFRRLASRRFSLLAARCCGAAALAVSADPALAGSLEVVAGSPLDFGALVVLGNGSKKVGPDGTVTANGVATVPGMREGPAEFTLRYRPDGRARTALVLVDLATTGSLQANGTTGTVSALVADLPGLSPQAKGDARAVRLPPCAAPSCETTFRVGGTLTVTGGAQAATFSFPLRVTVYLIAEL